MSTTVTPIIATSSSGPRKLPDTGTQVATIVQIVDIGTQTVVYQGEEKKQRKVRFVWELPEQLSQDDEGRDRPALIAKEFTLSTHERATLSGVIEKLTGKALTPEERTGYDVSKHLGDSCLVTITHKPRRDGSGEYAAIDGVSKLMKGQKKPAKYMPQVAWSVSAGRDAVFAKFPEWLKEKIEASAEFSKRTDDDDVPF